MNKTFRIQGQDFEWDSTKAAANLKKHGVSFEKACEVFFDPFVQCEEASDNHEYREAAIGYSEDWSLLYVVHVVRHEDRIRIISARPATPSERMRYEYE